jgi:hypothetical protein
MNNLKYLSLNAVGYGHTVPSSVSNELKKYLGRSYNIPDNFDAEDLMGGTKAVCFVRLC